MGLANQLRQLLLAVGPGIRRHQLNAQRHLIGIPFHVRLQERDGFAEAIVLLQPGDQLLLGAFTLEALGLALDPLRRELKPIPMML